MDVVQAVGSALGRLFLATIFLMSALGNKIPKFGQVVEYMTAHGVPMPNVSLVIAILLLVVGGVSVVIGYRVQFGAGMLALFLVLATYFFHNFWSYDPASPEFQQQMIQFMKNLGLLGAMVFLMSNGAGKGSLEQLGSSVTDQGKGQGV